MSAIEITVLRKADGLPLTKRISLGPDGSLRSDGSACVMSRGIAWRFRFSRIEQLAELIERFGPDQAIALGGLRPDLPDRVEVVTKRKLNGTTDPNVIARSRDYIIYRPGEFALALVDYDTKGMPPSVKRRLGELGGLWPALVSVIPELAAVARVVRKSTSAGLSRIDTGEKLSGSGGEHVFLVVEDGEDIERLLKTLHLRCWLAGLGWLMVGVGGQLLERSIVDRVVGSPERLVFEGAPVLDHPLAQDQASRRPVVTAGGALDSVAVCPPLTILEQSRLRELRAKETARLQLEADRARKAFIAEQAAPLVELTGIASNLALRVIERQCAGILLPDVVLPFDDEDLAGATVADVLADPDRFQDATLADPLEGVGYGAGKAKIMRRSDGTIWIHSFAHGRTVYELKFDYKAAKTVLEKAPVDELAALFVRLVLTADINPAEVEQLRNLVHGRAGIGKRPLDVMLKKARERQAAAEATAARERQFTERQDPRPFIPVPPPDAEWLPQMNTINEVLGKCLAIVPPLRDADRMCAQDRTITVPSLSSLSKEEANR
jgi:hypothetical protein